MKLLVDAHCFDRKVAEGMTTYIKGVYTHMPRLAPEIDFFFAANDTDKLEKTFGKAPNIHYTRLKSEGRLNRMLRSYPKLIRELGIDFAHFQYFAPPVKNCRTIITMHDVLFRDFPDSFPLSYRISRNIVFGHSAHHSDILATVSDYSRNRISHHYGIDRDKIIVTPNAVGDDFFNTDRAKARQCIYAKGIRPFLLNVSRIEPRKNQLALVKAYDELKLAERGYDLVLINQPTIPVAELERYINSRPEHVKRHIHRMDGLPHHELKEWYAAASLFVFPSLAEGFGIPPLEAAAAGTPTICHNDTSMADFNFLGTNLADLSDQETLKHLIEKNLFNPPSEKDLALTSKKIRDKYNWERSARVILKEIKN